MDKMKVFKHCFIGVFFLFGIFMQFQILAFLYTDPYYWNLYAWLLMITIPLSILASILFFIEVRTWPIH